MHEPVASPRPGRIPVKLQVSFDAQGERLDRYLSRQLKRYSRQRVQGIIREGNLELDGVTERKPARRLAGGETIVLWRPLPPEEQPRPPVPVIYQDRELLVLDKPGDLTVHPSANAYQRTVTGWLKEHHPAFTPAHRLDRETSGVMVCASRGAVSARVKGWFLARQVHKCYVALVRGEIPHDGRVEAPIGSDKHSPIRIKMAVCESGKPAWTDVYVLSRGREGALLALLPGTGRQHQLRVHCAHLGCPLWGDKMYGVDPTVFLTFIEEGVDAVLKTVRFRRHMLHQMVLTLPAAEETGVRWWSAPLPTDFRQAGDVLGVPILSDDALVGQLLTLL